MSKFLLIVLFFAPLLGFAELDRTLKIGVRDVPPFSVKTGAGTWEGISVELWDKLAADLGWDYEWVEFKSVNSLLDSLESGSIDVIASSISITAAREERFDFAHPFLSSNLAILAQNKQENRWMRVARSFISLPFMIALGSLALVLLMAGAALYFFERKANPEQFSEKPVEGLGDAFWWAAVTMTTVGYGDKSPVSLGGRLIALVWMFISVIILSTFTASIVSSLALPDKVQPIESIKDLRSGMVATVEGSTADSLLMRNQLRPVYVDNFREFTTILESSEIDAVVYDKPTLQFLIRQMSRDVYLIDLINNQEDYGFVLPEYSPLREAINRDLLKRLQQPSWHALKARYLQ
jgi:ABC-type amino acid transport substrate-binding protein